MSLSSADSMNFHRCQYSVLFIFIKALWIFFFHLKYELSSLKIPLMMQKCFVEDAFCHSWPGIISGISKNSWTEMGLSWIYWQLAKPVHTEGSSRSLLLMKEGKNFSSTHSATCGVKKASSSYHMLVQSCLVLVCSGMLLEM